SIVHRPLATRHSPLATRHSPSEVHKPVSAGAQGCEVQVIPLAKEHQRVAAAQGKQLPARAKAGRQRQYSPFLVSDGPIRAWLDGDDTPEQHGESLDPRVARDSSGVLLECRYDAHALYILCILQEGGRRVTLLDESTQVVGAGVVDDFGVEAGAGHEAG